MTSELKKDGYLMFAVFIIFYFSGMFFIIIYKTKLCSKTQVRIDPTVPSIRFGFNVLGCATGVVTFRKSFLQDHSVV